MSRRILFSFLVALLMFIPGSLLAQEQEADAVVTNEPSASYEAVPEPADSTAPAETESAVAAGDPSSDSLPQTASSLPLIALLGAVALCVAFGLQLRGRARARARG